jgi:histone deacetylase 11
MLLNPIFYATQGTIDAAVMAYEKGYSINLSGGYHHCHRKTGSGFCFMPDITLAITHVRKYLGVKRVMIIDLDAHQGNGHERDYIGDQETFIIDFYNPNIFPGDTYAKQAISVEFFVTHRVSDLEYCEKMEYLIEPSIVQFKPEFIVYNAGTDILEGDPLGNCSISAEGIQMRDQIVFDLAFKYQVPILMVLSGGYLKKNASVIAASVNNIYKKFGLPC